MPSAPPTSTVQMSKLVQDVAVSDADMLTIDVTLRKEDYGLPGSYDYRKNMTMATAGLPEKFVVAWHKIVSCGEEGDQPKSAHMQQMIIEIIHQLKEGVQHSRAIDFMDISTISGLGGNLGSSNPHDWWDRSKISIWVDWD